MADCKYDGNNHYLTTRGYLCWKDNNPVNIGAYMAYGTPPSAMTATPAGFETFILWSIPSDSAGKFASTTGTGRNAQLTFFTTEVQTPTARGGCMSFSATTTGDTRQTHGAWLHGTTGSFNIGGRYAQDDMSVITLFPGVGNLNIYHKADTQKLFTIRTVAGANAGTNQGIDWEFDATNSLYLFSGIWNNVQHQYCSLDPNTGNQLFPHRMGSIATSPVNTNTVGWKIDADGILYLTASTNPGLAVNRKGSDGNVLTAWREGVIVGNLNVTATTFALQSLSDGNFKTNRKPLELGDFFDKLDVLEYDWTTGGHGIGVIAQDLHTLLVEKELPLDAVGVGSLGDVSPEDPDYKKWTVAKAELIPLLIAEVKSLRLRIASLEAR